MFDFKKNSICYIKGGRYPHCHSIFIDDKIKVLIDPACEDTVLKKISSENSIDVIIMSHCHEDHFLNNYLFPEAKLWTHEKEANMFSDIEALVDAFQVAKDGPMREETRRFLVNDANYRAREPNRLLKDEEEIEFGETMLQVLHTPGHSPGHLSFYFPNEKVLYTADLDLVKAGPYYGDRDSDIDDMIRSLERLKGIEADHYLSAHGKYGVYEGNPEYIQDYLSIIFERENRLLESLAEKPLSLDEISDLGIIYGKKQVSGAWDLSFSEKMMMKKHVDRLIRADKIKRDSNCYVVC